MSKILQRGNPILNRKAIKIKSEEISSAKIRNLINELKKTLSQKKDGAALAAPQIGKSLRVFILADNIFENPETKTVFINPKIINFSKETEWMEEGCLSVKGVYGKVKRSTFCSIKAYDKDGKIFTQDGYGFISQIYQHEVDHLNGILFTEKAKDLITVDDSENIKKSKLQN